MMPTAPSILTGRGCFSYRFTLFLTSLNASCFAFPKAIACITTTDFQAFPNLKILEEGQIGA